MSDLASRIITTTLFSLPLLLLTACTTTHSYRLVVAPAIECSIDRADNSSPNTTAVRLMTGEGYLYPASCHKQALKYALSRKDEAGNAKPFLFFVHGRGQYPSKAANEDLLKRIESAYGVTAVMMTWPSWNGYSGLPDEQARSSAQDMASIFGILADIKLREGDRHFSLLTHSAGSLVLEEFARSSDEPLPEGLFDSLVLASSVSLVENHREWIDDLELAGSIYIVSNHDDVVLECLESEIRPLGLCARNSKDVLGRFVADPAESDQTSRNALYLDMTSQLERKHRYYIKVDEADSVHRFFNQVFNDEQVELDDYAVIIPGRAYRL